jgi:hypothetical protein
VAQVINENDKPIQQTTRLTASPASVPRHVSTRLSTVPVSAGGDYSISMQHNLPQALTFDEEFGIFRGMELDDELCNWVSCSFGDSTTHTFNNLLQPQIGPRKKTVKLDVCSGVEVAYLS